MEKATPPRGGAPPADFNSLTPKIATYHSAKGLTFDCVILPKLVPDDKVLESAYRRACFAHRMDHEIERLSNTLRAEADAAPVPNALPAQVKAHLRKTPAAPWDAAVSEIARNCAPPAASPAASCPSAPPPERNDAWA